MSKIQKQQEILHNLLEKLLLPRILLLEQKDLAKEADLVLCNSQANYAIKIINAPFTPPHHHLESRPNSRPKRESSKSVKERGTRPTTPANKIHRDSHNRDSIKLRNDKSKKNLDSSYSVISQKSTQTNIKTNKIPDFNSEKSHLNFKTNDKSKGQFFPNVKAFERKQTPTNFMIRDKLHKNKSLKNFSLEKYNSKKNLCKNTNISKTSIAEINKVNLSSLNTSATRTVQGKQNKGKYLNIIDTVSYVNTETNLKFVKSDLDVSNLITLEQEVNDELIINQNEDKLLNNCLNEYDERNQVSNRKLSSEKNDNKIIPKGFYQVLDEKWNLISKFLVKDDYISLMVISKKFYRLSINKLLANNKTEITNYNEKIKYLYEKYSEKELSSPIPEVTLSKGSIKAIELLNTPIYNKLFNLNNVPQESIILPYRLYFTLIGRYDICNFKKYEEFWKECCEYFIRESENTGDIINNSLKTIDLSDANIYKLSRILQNKEKFISPNYYSKSCATSGLIIFILKDILEYLGLISDKRTIPSQLLKLNKILYNKSIEIQIKLISLDKRFQFN